MNAYLPLILLAVVLGPLFVFVARLYRSTFKRDRWTR